MKLTVTKTETQEIDVSFPMFKKHGANYYNIISEDNWIEIDTKEFILGYAGIKIFIEKPAYWQIILIDGEDVTEDEFNEKFIEVFNKIKSYKPQYSVI